MTYLLWAVAFLGVLQSAASKPHQLDKRWEERKMKHEWIDVPKGWFEVVRPSVGCSLKMSIGLQRGRSGGLLEHLYEISHPEHHSGAFVFAPSVRCPLTRAERPDTAITF